MELNASDERGIDAVRNKIKSFSSLAVQPGPVPFKVIILDEADSMTKDAQNALRRIIKVHSAVTRFIIICNYISKIIDPILSRCARFRFQRLTKESVIKRLEFIAQEENLVIDDQDVFETLFNISNGDMRKAITFLQSASVTGSISSLLLLEISGTPRVDLVSDFVGVCLKQSWGAIEKATSNVVLSGFDLSQVLEILLSIVIDSDQIKEDLKPRLILKIADVDGHITLRADPELQFLSIAAQLMVSSVSR